MFAKMMKPIAILWRFSRPHTIIGSLLSVTALFFLALADIHDFQLHTETWLVTLFSCLCCNIFITGLNQWADVEIDRLNKPYLPIASGELKRSTAFVVCITFLILALASALWLSWGFFFLIALISLIGAAYSLPPLRFKKHHFGAAAAIAAVRGIMVNVGLFLHYRFELLNQLDFPAYMIALTVFVTAFSIGIAWFKDIPDTDGDAHHGVKTLPLALSRKKALLMGVVLVSLTYISMSVYLFVNQFYVGAVYHILALLVFVLPVVKLKYSDNVEVYKFYMMFWVLFFIEYLTYPLIIQFHL